MINKYIIRQIIKTFKKNYFSKVKIAKLDFSMGKEIIVKVL